MKATLRCVALQLLFSVLSAASSPGAERHTFEASGHVETVGIPAHDPTAGTTNRRAFFAVRDGPRLLIRCNAGTADKGVDYSEFGSDGTNGFHFAKTLLRADPSSPRGVVNDATLHIEPSPAPPRVSGALRNLWLVYSGQLNQENRTNAFLKPQGTSMPWTSPFDRDLYEILNDYLLLRADWAFDDQAPHLLKTFVDYRDSLLASDRYSQSLIPAEFMTGKTNSRLDVLAWTNVAGLHIPVHVRRADYLADATRPERPLHMSVVHHIVATNVVAGTKRQDFVPKVTKATSVCDYRFAEGPRQPARYLTTNGIILGTAEEAWAVARRAGAKRTE